MNQVSAAQLGEFVADRVRGLDFMQAKEQQFGLLQQFLKCKSGSLPKGVWSFYGSLFIFRDVSVENSYFSCPSDPTKVRRLYLGLDGDGDEGMMRMLQHRPQ